MSILSRLANVFCVIINFSITPVRKRKYTECKFIPRVTANFGGNYTRGSHGESNTFFAVIEREVSQRNTSKSGRVKKNPVTI